MKSLTDLLPRFAQRHQDHQRLATPGAAAEVSGVINESAKDSKLWWPPRLVSPKGAPNVLLIMTGDQGYGVSGIFGGPSIWVPAR